MSGQNISIGSFHALFNNVSIYIKGIQKLVMKSENFIDKKSFQSKANCLPANRCIGNIINMFEQVQGGMELALRVVPR